MTRANGHDAPTYTLPVWREDRHESRSAYSGICACGAHVQTERSRYATLVANVTCPACGSLMTITKGGL